MADVNTGVFVYDSSTGEESFRVTFRQSINRRIRTITEQPIAISYRDAYISDTLQFCDVLLEIGMQIDGA